MATFNGTSEESLATANQVMREASGVVRVPDVEAVPGLRQVVASAAMVLEKHPPIGRNPVTSKAQDWLDPWADEGAVFIRAVGHLVEDRKGSTVIDQSPANLTQRLVTDVNVMQSAEWMREAVDRGIDPKAIGLTQGQADRVEQARQDPETAQAIRDEARGLYHRLPRSRQMDLVDVLHEAEGVAPSARSDLGAMALELAATKAGAQERNGYLHAKISDFGDAEIPLFRDGDHGAADRVSSAAARALDLSLGIGDLPRDEVERGVAAHVAAMGPQTSAGVDRTGLEARTRVLAELDLSDEPAGSVLPDPASRSAAQVAIRVEAMAVALRDAYLKVSGGRDNANGDMQSLADGQPSRMTRESQVRLFEALHHGDGVPALSAARLHSAVRDMDAADGAMSQDQQLQSRREGQSQKDAGMVVRQRAAEFSRG